MSSFVKFAIVLLVSFGYVYGQEEDFLGLPLDFDDTFGLDFRNAYFEKEKENIWDEDDLQPNLQSQDVVKILCDEYELYLNEQNIDCKNIKFVQKTLKINEHNIRKREINDEQEGSGEEGAHIETDLVVEPRNYQEPVPYDEINGEEAENNFTAADSMTEAQEINESENDNKKELATVLETEEPVPFETEESVIVPDVDAPQPTEIPAVEAPTASLNIDESTILDIQEEVTAAPEEIKEGEPTSQPEEELVQTSATPNEQPVAEPVEESTSQTIQETDIEEDVLVPTEITAEPKEDIVPIENTEAPIDVIATEADVANSIDLSVTETPDLIAEPKEGNVPDETNKEITGSPIVENEATEETAVSKIVLGDKKGRKLVATNEQNQKETENVNDQQSGNAIVVNSGSGSLAESEAAIKKMSSNAEIQHAQSNSEEPKSGESATETSTSRKDTKILIILFVAVVVVGCAALSYNFIKKRKQKKAEEARAENGGGNNLKRSIQNLSGNPKSDPEQGTELKPLMKNDKPIIEFKDEKENNTAEANK